MSQVTDRSTAERHRLPVRTLVAASIGNAVEWFDWTIYATFAVFFSSQFFDKSDPTLALIGTTSTYALAFFFRPLGGVLLGRLADLRGRRFAMIITIVLMAGGSMVIAILPTFQMIGWFAPILLLLARIAQGLALGGEVSNASVYLAEIAPPRWRGRYSSFFYTSTGVALLLASLLGLLLTSSLSRPALESWGWRVAFAVGGLLGLIGMWLRRTLTETEQFAENAERAKQTHHPLVRTLVDHPRSVVQLVGFTLLATLCFYAFFTAITPFAVGFRGASGDEVFLALSIGTVVFIAAQYPLGALSDRVGRKPLLLTWAALMALLVVPLSLLITPSPPLINLILVFVIGLAVYAVSASLSPAIMSELFPTELRALGIGAWYNLTVAVFGGTAPLVLSTLSRAGRPSLFFWYVAVAAVITFVVLLTLPETKGKALE